MIRLFRTLAPRLRDMGWEALIPLTPGEKAPAISRWQRFNAEPPSEVQIDGWAETHGGCGIGLAFGPDRVVAVDADFTDAAKSARTREIMVETLGSSPMTRIGRMPKFLQFYRADGLRVEGRAFGGFEIYVSSGQCVLYGVHPATGQPYNWPEESPETMSPGDLPVINQAQLNAFIAAMEPMREDKTIVRGATVCNTGRAAAWMSMFANINSPSEMIEAAADGVRGVGAGARHFTMQAVVMALVSRGIAPHEFVDVIEEAYVETLTREEAAKRRNAVASAARWADQKIWGGKASIEPVTLAEGGW